MKKAISSSPTHYMILRLRKNVSSRLFDFGCENVAHIRSKARRVKILNWLEGACLVTLKCMQSWSRYRGGKGGGCRGVSQGPAEGEGGLRTDRAGPRVRSIRSSVRTSWPHCLDSHMQNPPTPSRRGAVSPHPIHWPRPPFSPNNFHRTGVFETGGRRRRVLCHTMLPRFLIYSFSPFSKTRGRFTFRIGLLICVLRLDRPHVQRNQVVGLENFIPNWY